ncbi:hypothetical protein FA13DRAFT_804194 [Coprinellus micaceus]|uniref:Secreted protein n=1 Tax=Coprinellus micaceus TaxID=71717 RepID=A0A4Y7T2S6_COPMI|nr:hypothetical protein FA13DRAFT_804194 [Coprinellus micaceus]
MLLFICFSPSLFATPSSTWPTHATLAPTLNDHRVRSGEEVPPGWGEHGPFRSGRWVDALFVGFHGLFELRYSDPSFVSSESNVLFGSLIHPIAFGPLVAPRFVRTPRRTALRFHPALTCSLSPLVRCCGMAALRSDCAHGWELDISCSCFWEPHFGATWFFYVITFFRPRRFLVHTLTGSSQSRPPFTPSALHLPFIPSPLPLSLSHFPSSTHSLTPPTLQINQRSRNRSL